LKKEKVKGASCWCGETRREDNNWRFIGRGKTHGDVHEAFLMIAGRGLEYNEGKSEENEVAGVKT